VVVDGKDRKGVRDDLLKLWKPTTTRNNILWQLWDAGRPLDITTIPGIRNALFGGDGLFLAALTGPGRVWLQSLPLPNLAHALQPYLSQQEVAAGASGGITGAVLAATGRLVEMDTVSTYTLSGMGNTLATQLVWSRWNDPSLTIPTVPAS